MTIRRVALFVFARMTDGDLRAIYRYLRSLPAVSHDPGPSLRPKD